MVAAAPFRGLRFDAAVVGDLAKVTTPPYDVISAAARDAYEAMSPHSMVRLILHRGGSDDPARYQQVAKLLAAWRDEGALLLDPAPSLYLYEEAYTLDGERRVQRGVLASVALDDSATWVLPHERTMAAPVADRLRLLEATRVNLSPVFGVYAGGGRAAGLLDEAAAAPPAVDCVDEVGVGHRLWPFADPGRVAAFRELLADRQVLIADGHHRYRTSLAYQAATRAATGGRPGPWDEVLMFLADADHQGPSVQAHHRLLADVPGQAVLDGLAGEFDARPAAGPAAAEAALRRLPRTAIGFGLYAGGASFVLVARDPGRLAAETRLDRDPLDVEVLHGPVLAGRLGVRDFERRVAYDSDLAHAVGRVDGGAAASLLLVRPAPFAAVAEVARAGGTLPQKTTSFVPKPRDGLVLRPLEPAAFAPQPGGRR
jgi:uncharacterized protein (DUF1015 family)